jgi:simple sugar transport system permease protein
VSRPAAALAAPAAALLLSLLIGACLVALAGVDPVAALLGLAQGAAGSPGALAQTLTAATPLLLASLGVSVAFRAGLFNIGAEGQLVLGSLAAAWTGWALPASTGWRPPAFVLLPLALAASFLAGGVWGAVPGYLRARFGAHEVINTIMMNYLALIGVSFLLNGPLKDPDPLNVLARTPAILPEARLPLFGSGPLHAGILLAVAAAFAVAFMLRRTVWGYELVTAGADAGVARAAGIDVRRTSVSAMALGGALAGLAGGVEVCGVHYRHEVGFSPGYGFEAVAVALLGRAHPLGVAAAALLFGALKAGAPRMQFLTQMPIDLIVLLQGLIILFSAAAMGRLPGLLLRRPPAAEAPRC